MKRVVTKGEKKEGNKRVKKTGEEATRKKKYE